MRDEQKGEGITMRSKQTGIRQGKFIAGAEDVVGNELSLREVEPWLPERWDKETDVVVIGYGGGGAVTALTARNQGAEVLVLEKAPYGGGNSICIGGGLLVPVDEERAVEYIKWLTVGLTEEDVIRAYVKRLVKLPQWLRQIGIPGTEGEPETVPGLYPEWHKAPGAEGIKGYEIGASGPAIYNTVAGHVEEAGVEIMYNTPAKKLIQNWKTKEILGLVAESKGRAIFIRARKAVVLACGGFEFDERMVKDNLTECPLVFAGTPYNTGDGVRMAQQVGAQLWHMHSQAAPMLVGIKTPDNDVYCTPFIVRDIPNTHKKGGCIWVNRRGERFFNELTNLHFLRHGAVLRRDWYDYDAMKMEFIDFPAWIIFDESARTAGPIMTSYWIGTTPWSTDNKREIEKGWVVKADTIGELASKCKMINEAGKEVCIPADRLKETIEEYNRYCESGEDPDFHREDGLMSIKTPPFYVVQRVVPAGVNTQGGPKHDARGRVLSVDNETIPRLYAVGECGSLWGPYYNGGGNVTEFMTMGLIVGENVATETRWE